MSSQKTVSALLAQAEKDLAKRAFKEAHLACIEALKLAPDTPDAFYLLGVLTAEHDNHAKAVELFDRAIDISASIAAYHAWKGRSLIALNRRELALEAAEIAANCSDLKAQTLDTIGVIYSRAGLHDRATEFYQQATGKDASKASYWYNLGSAEQFQGNFGAAQTAYRKTTALNPKNVKAWSSLIQITKQTDTANDISALEALFETLSTADDRLYIGHALAKAYEDLAQPTPAMAWLAKAKATKRSEIDYKPEQDKALFAAAARTVTATAQDGHHDRTPIFIIGLPRTGTTLVDRILSSHPEIQSAGELTDFALALKRATGTPSRYVLDAETLDAAANVDLATVGREYISMARRVVPDAAHFVDKMPLNFFSAAVIQRALPEARIICLRRHPADSVLSNYRQLFATGFSYYNYAFDLADTAAYYAQFDTLIEQFKEALPADRFTEVAYEDIIDDLETQARRLIAFCGLDWDPACLSFHQNKAPVATASSVQVRQPLYSSSVGRWQRYSEHMQPALDVLRAHGLIPD